MIYLNAKNNENIPDIREDSKKNERVFGKIAGDSTLIATEKEEFAQLHRDSEKSELLENQVSNMQNEIKVKDRKIGRLTKKIELLQSGQHYSEKEKLLLVLLTALTTLLIMILGESINYYKYTSEILENHPLVIIVFLVISLIIIALVYLFIWVKPRN